LKTIMCVVLVIETLYIADKLMCYLLYTTQI